jgi:dienelactone hydrolase
MPHVFLSLIYKGLFSYVLTFCVLMPLTASASDYTAITLLRQDGVNISVRLFGNWEQELCPPTVVLSHGFGGSEKGLAYIGEGLAKQGHRAITMGHTESGGVGNIVHALLVTREKKGALLTDPEKYAGRFMDIEAVLAYVKQGCTIPPFLILAGHSMGAGAVMLEAGAKGKLPKITSKLGKNRFDAYVAISPQGVGYLYDKGAWNNIHKPVLMITGTEDDGFDGDYTSRLSAFAGLPLGNKRLAVINGATHYYLGGGRGGRLSVPTKQKVVTLIGEFINQIQINGTLLPVAHMGISITDK